MITSFSTPDGREAQATLFIVSSTFRISLYTGIRMESFLIFDITKGDEFVHSIIPPEDDEFIAHCHEDIVKTKYIGSEIEYTQIEE